MPENPNLPCFTESKFHWNYEKQSKKNGPRFNHFWRWLGYTSMPSGYSFSTENHEDPKPSLFVKSNWHLNKKKSARHVQNLISSEDCKIYQLAKLQANLSNHPLENAQKHQIWLVSLCKTCAKITKFISPWSISSQFLRRWLGYIGIPNFRPFLLCAHPIMTKMTNRFLAYATLKCDRWSWKAKSYRILESKWLYIHRLLHIRIYNILRCE